MTAAAEHSRSYRSRHPERVKEIERRHKQKVKRQAIDHYGGRCACCGVSELIFLCIDHIDGGGNKHRKEVSGYGSGFYAWLKRNDYPPGFRVLCWNCNHAHRMGSCPHEVN